MPRRRWVRVDTSVLESALVSENAADVMKEVVSRRPEDLTYITNNIIGENGEGA